MNAILDTSPKSTEPIDAPAPVFMSSELSPGRRPRRSLENFDPSNASEPILSSPRSVEACRRGGILAKDLVFRYADSFGDKFVSEEIKEMRARHYEEMRVMKLSIVKDEFVKVRHAPRSLARLPSDHLRSCATKQAALRGKAPAELSISTRAPPWRGSSAQSTPCAPAARLSSTKWCASRMSCVL
jgi:hypothetical protein